MEPVRVKLYGVLSMTRRRYERQLWLALLSSAVVVGCWWWLWPAYRREVPPGNLDRFVAVMDHLPWIVLAAIALQFVEAFFVFRLFRAREAQQAVSPPASISSGA